MYGLVPCGTVHDARRIAVEDDTLRKMRCRLQVSTVMAALLCTQLVAMASPPSEPPQESLQKAVKLFAAKRYAEAIPLLQMVHSDPELRGEVVLLLGICLYRTHDLRKAEPLLQKASESPDAETREAAQLFLGLLFDELGATDQAQDQLGKAAGSQTFGGSAQKLIEQRRSHRLLISVLVAPEFDGNVRLADTTTWKDAPTDATDGDILLLASLGIRPFRFGLSLGNVLSYRQQLRLRDYSLLLDSTWLGYSYAGTRHRFRVHTAFDIAMLSGSQLFMDFDGRIADRLRLWSQLGIAASYGFRYRSYAIRDYQSLSGQTHQGQLELSWGTMPEPITVQVGYVLLRDELEAPVTPLSSTDDYRAWAHGPHLRMRTRLHQRVEWSLSAQYLRRLFDYVPGPEIPAERGISRLDDFFSVDTSVAVRFGGYFEGFVGGSMVANRSNKDAFSYLKPTAYLGIAAYFGLL